MFCSNCGKVLEEGSLYCNHCGKKANLDETVSSQKENYKFGFGILSFFVPILGLIFFLIYENKKPQRAKAAGIGALAGFLTGVILFISLFAFAMLYPAFGLFSTPSLSVEDYLTNYVDVEFGELVVSDKLYYVKTSLDVTVKNKSDERCDYYIEIDLVDSEGYRIARETVSADDLAPGQSIKLKAFESMDDVDIDRLNNVSYQIVGIRKY